jgi:hypothetical protein
MRETSMLAVAQGILTSVAICSGLGKESANLFYSKAQREKYELHVFISPE